MRILLLILLLCLSSCASWDGEGTTLHPLRQQDGNQIYQFSTTANFVYPLESKEAEKIRINWLEEQLRKHGLDDKNYLILDRKAVEAKGGLIGGKAYYLYYEVKAKETD